MQLKYRFSLKNQLIEEQTALLVSKNSIPTHGAQHKYDKMTESSTINSKSQFNNIQENLMIMKNLSSP
jgi:hypothetical protein